MCERFAWISWNLLQELLISTGAAKIIEITMNEANWGAGCNSSIENMRGRILVEVRE